MHRLEVHGWVSDQENLRQLQVGILASRGDAKAVADFERKTTERHAPKAVHTGLPTRAAPPTVAARLGEEHADLPWVKRDSA